MTLFSYDFMQHAFLAGTLAAFVSAIIGYFVVLRNQSFAGHALSHIGFAGAAGAGLMGLTPFTGQLLLTMLSAIGMGVLGERTYKSDVAIGIVLAFFMALGVLFLYLYNAYAAQAMNILFGDLLGISTALLKKLVFFSIISLIGIGILARPLLFATLEPELAEASGLSLRWISVGFLMLVSIAVTEATMAIGILLVFTLLIAPPAAALRLTRTVWRGILLSILFGITSTWLGITLSFYTNWPISFWITTVSLVIYLLSFLL